MFEAIIIYAMEVCQDSHSYDGCVKWYRQCMIEQIVHHSERDFSSSGEHCAENMPKWATEGM